MCGDILTFYHFNDVHTSLNREKVGRFATLLRQAKEGLNPLRAETPKKIKGVSPPMVVLSSKVFAPRQNSTAGDVTALLQKFPIDVVCCVSDSAPGSNAADPSPYAKPLGSPHVNLLGTGLAEAEAALPPDIVSSFEIKQHGPYRIGFFGMVGIDWGAKEAPSEKLPIGWKEKLIYEAQTNARLLRNEQNCDFVIAVTNMRLVEDILISKETLKADSKIDLIFGGHDGQVLQRSADETNSNPAVAIPAAGNDRKLSAAWVETIPADHVRIVKSGTEWESISVVEVCIHPSPGISKKTGNPLKPKMTPLRVNQMLRIERHPYFSELAPAGDILSLIDTINGPALRNLTSRPLFLSQTKLNGRERELRHEESNLGNFIADAMKAYYDADIALYPSKSIRCDRLIGAPKENPLPITITGYDVIDCFPFQNNLVMKLIKGEALLAALENSLSNRHADGRFLQISGLKLEASWQRPQGSRLISASWIFDLLNGGGKIEEPIYPDQTYMVAMTEWMANGWGGYKMLADDARWLRNGSAVGITDTDLMLSTFAGWGQDDEKWFWSDKDGEDIAWYFDGGNKMPVREYQLRQVRSKVVKHLETEHALPQVKPEVDGRMAFVKEQRQLEADQWKALEGGGESLAAIAMKEPVEGFPSLNL
ncbi:5'-nucleotidase [Cladorrhinum sp. PSN332]|nr:5'-nucleotidase [Cladorrhinum sp. PSN332]